MRQTSEVTTQLKEKLDKMMEEHRKIWSIDPSKVQSYLYWEQLKELKELLE